MANRPKEQAEEYWGGYDDLDFDSPICNNCKHKNKTNVNCEAYPLGIPLEILDNSVDHTKKYINDNNIQFEPID
tara:strand:+ start:276 stop:497 length:222 start_codon:yes stop_codon:yes gene_type:complete